MRDRSAGGGRGAGGAGGRGREGGGKGGAVGGGRGGVLPVSVHRRGAAAMLTKKPGVSVHPTGEYDPPVPAVQAPEPGRCGRE